MIDYSDAGRLASLTDTEQAVLGLLAEGADPAEIAKVQFTSIETTRTHVRHILAKLGESTQKNAAILVWRERGSRLLSDMGRLREDNDILRRSGEHQEAVATALAAAQADQQKRAGVRARSGAAAKPGTYHSPGAAQRAAHRRGASNRARAGRTGGTRA